MESTDDPGRFFLYEVYRDKEGFAGHQQTDHYIRWRDTVKDWMAESRVDAEQAFDLFLSTYEAKYPKASECLAKDREPLLTFYDFPAEHWLHLRTTNPIESTFATVRLRTSKTRGCVACAGLLAMVFKLTKTAEQKWHKLRGHARLGQVIEGVKFKDGLQQEAQRIAA